VRQEALARDLITAEKPDSHDICFIPDGDTAGWLKERLGEQMADIVDVRTGEVLARTDTPYAVTIGQRRGLDLGRPAADGAPRYVVDVDLVTRRIEVGPRELLLVSEITGEQVRWCGERLAGPIIGEVQVRAHGEPVDAVVEVDGDRVIARLSSPIQGVARGQALVVYSGTRVIASATIDGTS
jgi:tRNA-specific 2-thiouridylase